jgi:hypothetical protein
MAAASLTRAARNAVRPFGSIIPARWRRRRGYSLGSPFDWRNRCQHFSRTSNCGSSLQVSKQLAAHALNALTQLLRSEGTFGPSCWRRLASRPI